MNVNKEQRRFLMRQKAVIKTVEDILRNTEKQLDELKKGKDFETSCELIACNLQCSVLNLAAVKNEIQCMETELGKSD